MTKNKLMLLISIIVILLLTGCSFINNKSVSSNKPKEGSPKVSSGDYLIGKKSLNIPDSNLWEETYGEQVGVFSKNFGEYKGYLIGLGQKPTGGYGINIEVNQEQKDILINFTEKTPPKGSYTTQVITYNYNVIYLKNIYDMVQLYQIINGKKVLITDIIKSK